MKKLMVLKRNKKVLKAAVLDRPIRGQADRPAPTAETFDAARIKPLLKKTMPEHMPADSTVFWSRRPHISVCLEGDNAILFDPDTSREKVINHTGLAIWNAMDGTTRTEGLAASLACRYGIQLTGEIRADAAALANELLRDGYAATSATPSLEPAGAEAYSWIQEAPRDIDLSLTGKCNLGCAYCFYADEMVGRRDLHAQRWLIFFAELRSLAVRRLTLSGGEIFLRPDLWELIDAIVDARMRYSILSNGTLITEKTVGQLLQAGRRSRLDSIQISIDGSCAAVHDQSRGKGSFKKAMAGLRLLKEAGFPVTVRLTVNRYNVDDLANTARLLLDEIGLAGFSTNDAMPMGMGCTHQDSIVLTPRQRLTAMKTLVQIEKAYPGRITASAGSLALWHMFQDMEQARATGTLARRWKMGALSSCGCMFLKLAVHHDGIIAPCNMLASASLGTIGETPLNAIWQNHPLLQKMRQRGNISIDTVSGCTGCEWAPYCNGGCPAVEYTRTGNLRVVNPSCCYRLFIEETGGPPDVAGAA
jgi:SynChlorMet cassette radical SAM/SPASM protein ScmE